jgi:PAS domain S-box-containing protein
MDKVQFGERVRFLRRLEGLTMQALAERVGITVLHLGNIERGTASPSFVLIIRLAEGLRTEPVNLFLVNGFPSGESTGLGLGDRSGQWHKYVTRFGLWEYDLESKSFHFSASMARMMGRASRPYTTTLAGFMATIHQDDRPHMQAGWERFRGGEYDHMDTFRFFRADGVRRLGMIQGNVELDQQGLPLGFAGIILDITEQRQFEMAQASTVAKIEHLVQERTSHLQDARSAAEREAKSRARAEAEARKQERLFRELFENMHDGFVRFDEQGLVVLVNKSTADTLGYPDPESLLGMSVLELYADPAQREALLNKLAQAGRFTNQKFRFKRRDGTHGWALVNAQVLYDEEGRRAGSEAVVRDVTDRIEAEDQLRDALNLLEATASIAQVGGWTYAPATGLATWTAQTCRMHDLPEGYVSSLEEGIRNYHPQDQPLLAQAINRAIVQGVPYDLELRLITAKKRERWVRTICQPELRGGAVHLLRGIVQDITQRKEMEKQLRFSKERYDLLGRYLQSRLVLYSHADDGRLVHVSEGVRLVRGQTAQQVLAQGLTWRNVADWTPESILRAEEQQRRLVTGETDHVVFDMSFHQPSGGLGYLNVYGYFRWGESQEVVFEGVAIDVTRQREAEKQAEILQQVVDTLPVGVAILDARALILSVNPAFIRITGYTTDRAVGQNLSALIFGSDHGDVCDQLLETIRNSQTQRGPILFQRQDDDPVQAMATMAPFADLHGTITHCILLLEENRHQH